MKKRKREQLIMSRASETIDRLTTDDNDEK